MKPVPRFGTILLCLFVALGATCFPACNRPRDDRQPGVLTLRLITDPSTLDPALITDVMGATVAAKLFNGLVRFDARLNIVPDLAESWSISRDRRTYTFRLRKNATFGNHRPATASDFVYSFERVLNPKTQAPRTWVLDRIEGAQDVLAGKTDRLSGLAAPDERTLVITLDRPFGPFLSLLGMTTAYAVPREEIERLGRDFGSRPVGTGPYSLSSWKHGQELVLRSRQEYFEGPARLNGIRYRIIPEDLTAVVEFETGRLDALQIPAAAYRRFTNDPAWRTRIYGLPGLNTYYLGMNCSRPPFNDVRVRRAMNMAIDRRRILDTIFEKRGILAAGPVPPALWKSPRQAREAGYPYDPEQAKRLIEDAGAKGAHIRIFISAEPEVLDIVEVIQSYLTQAGITADIVQLDWNAFKEAINKGEPDAFWLSWWADYPDPENFLFPLFHSANRGPAGNRTWFSDAAFDRLIERALAATDDRQRFELYRAAEQRVVGSAPWVFMWHRTDYYVVQPRVGNFTLWPVYSADKGLNVSLAQ